MDLKLYKLEEIVMKLRQVEVLTIQMATIIERLGLGCASNVIRFISSLEAP